MRRLICALATAALLTGISASPASADFGLSSMEVVFSEFGGTPATLAGTHPYQQRISFKVNSKEGGKLVDGAIKDLDIIAPPGLVGNPKAVPPCETVDFLDLVGGCGDSTAVGTLHVVLGGGGGDVGEETTAIFNLHPSPGVAAKLGFVINEVPITINLGVRPTPPYNIVGSLANANQTVEVISSDAILWGNPADSRHDPDRGDCAKEEGDSCEANIPDKPFLLLPRSCSGPLLTIFQARSWWTGNPLFPGPSSEFEGSAESAGMEECAGLHFAPSLQVQPSTESADSPTGLDVSLDIDDEGIGDPDGTAHSDIQKAVIELPEGVTANPSLAEGLATCSPAQLDLETVNSQPGDGCPQASKVGTVEAETPILEDKVLRGELFIASQDDPTTTTLGAENPFDTLLALYMVIRDTELGVIVKLAGKVDPDLTTGQLVVTFDDLPQVPVAHFRTHLREGGRSPLISPPGCGTFTTLAHLTPSANPAKPLTVPSSFQITRGVGGGPCPPAGTPPFAPGFQAGSINNNAGSHSPFYMRLARRDGDQDLTRFDATLPPGLVAKFIGVAKCPDEAIAAAKAKRGKVELASPSCPAASEIGHVTGGAGVGSQLTYVPGRLYLAGPFGGAPLSVVGIVPAVAGPFDVGTVVVRQALDVDPRTAEGKIDGAHSDPIPHILAGIPLRVRDIRVHVDRPSFTLNPTDCDPFATKAQIWGGGSNAFTTADDAPVAKDARFQAANCARLRFKPRLSLTLKGGSKRGGHPALRALYRPRPGHANVSDLITRLPRSAFLDQAHIRTICTRVQFAANACPKGAIYGRITAITPLFEEPFKGPVYLRSSSHNLPDLVFDLHGVVDVEASARIDSIKGGIRATFKDIPDAPLTKVVLEMQGAKKGLIINSRNLCAGPSRANVELTAHNGRGLDLRPQLKPSGCGGQGKRGSGG